jgi:tetratricopeptide (TPR) repeat protein
MQKLRLCLQESADSMAKNKLASALVFIPILFWASESFAEENQAASVPIVKQTQGYAGSSSCRECHEKFYELWSTSMHGLAMQPYTSEFAKTRLSPQQNDVVIGKLKYLANLHEGVVVETGPRGEKKYLIEHVLGGKNVCYFLTPLKKGRLQTLPVAYDVNKKEWFDTAASGMRHFPGGETGQAVNWKESPYTFNMACYSCHVSQLSTNYDPKADTYHTSWTEPGINCETCHGPSGEHVKLARATPKGQPLPELRLIRTKTMTKEQRNDLCASCHAKASPLSLEYKPEERFFDHFNLVTLEDPDYYPDGRDLGENYTFTSWRMSPCVKSGQLDCLHCHTSSGRYRFKDEAKANEACLPCHLERVLNATPHTHHPQGSPGNLCRSCHMPMTDFARMNRTDHSMLPPTPAATLAYRSPNACNVCHKERDAAWADKYVREWCTRDYQAPVLKRAALIDAARKRDWSKLPEMLAYIQGKDRDEVFTTSLMRLMVMTPDERVTPVLLKVMKDPSPLVRSGAVEALSTRLSPLAIQAMLDATGDASRLVRTRASAGLAGYPLERLTGKAKMRVDKANKEYLAFILARPDQWSSHYNLGNYQVSRRELKSAVDSYLTALKLEPQAVMAMVNLSIAYAQMRENDQAEKFLLEALKIAPNSAAANLNMGLLKAEKSERAQAEVYLKKAFQADPQMAQAAYNLCILTSKDRIDEALNWCRKATALRPQEPKYTFTLAFYLNQEGDTTAAIKLLNGMIVKYPLYADSYLLLGGIYEKQGKESEAERIYGKALALEGIPPQYRHQIANQQEALKRSGSSTGTK